MTEKKSLVEEALLQMKNLEQVVAENAKGILASTMKEEISELVKESLKNETEKESKEVEMDEQSEDDLDMDIDMDSDDENMDDVEMDIDMDSDDDESDDELEMDFDMDSDDTLPIDLTNASDDEILKVFKSMSDEDGIIVKQDGNNITLNDEDEDVEYIIQTESDMEEETMEEMDEEEELSDEDLDSMMADIFGEEMNMDEESMYEEDMDEEDMDDEVVYEIEMDEDEDMDDSDDSDESMSEGKMTIKPVMGKLTKSSLTNKAKKMETKEGSMMSKPVVGKGVKTGSAKFEYKEGRKMEAKEAAIEPKGKAKGVGMNLKPKKFEYTEAEMEEKYGSKKHEYRRKDVDGVEKKAGEKGGHYKDYEKEETKEAARTLGNGTRNYAERKGLPKMKVIPNQALAEEVERLREKNEEYRKALNIFREKLNEVAVFNSNLAYATRLFTEHTTTKQEKINILRRFDDVESLKESKSLYSSIKNELNNTTQNVVTESMEKIGKSPASGSSQNLIESKTYENPQFLRMKDIMQKIQK
jgi:hypothetical protein